MGHARGTHTYGRYKEYSPGQSVVSLSPLTNRSAVLIHFCERVFLSFVTYEIDFPIFVLGCGDEWMDGLKGAPLSSATPQVRAANKSYIERENYRSE